MLLNVSGVTVQPQTGVHDLVLFRGLDTLNSGLILVDGAPEPEASYYQLYNVQRVEVLKGPAGFLYGANPLGGAINLVRTSADRPWVHQHRASGGSFGTLRYEVDLNTRGHERGAAFRFNGLYASSDGYRDRQDSEVVGVNPTATWWLGEDSALRLNAEWLGSDSRAAKVTQKATHPGNARKRPPREARGSAIAAVATTASARTQAISPPSAMRLLWGSSPRRMPCSLEWWAWAVWA